MVFAVTFTLLAVEPPGYAPMRRADKQAAGKLPPPAAAPASGSASSSAHSAAASEAPEDDGPLNLDPGMVHGLGAVLAVAVPACMTNAKKKVRKLGSKQMACSRVTAHAVPHRG